MLPLMAVVGSGFPRSGMNSLESPQFTERLLPGLKDLRTARNLSPLYPETHLLLGQHARAFAQADPPLAYFERAKTLNPCDPNIWYACGRAHRDAGNLAGAAENWHRSLELSPQQLAAILAESRARFTVNDILARILPENPVTLVQAAEHYRDDPQARRAILDRATGATETPGWTWKSRVAVAEAADLLGRTADAEALWNRAMAADPTQYEVRNAFALFLEREERYEEAMTQLNWLIKVNPGNTQLRDRALFARHGIELNEQLKK
jgi:tetratricopeptide (TPR) repeat protein